MAFHDYYCPGCARLIEDYNVPIAVGAQAGAPHCPEDGRRMEWIPKVGRMDAYEPFQEFDIKDGRNQPIHIDSLRKLRQVERDSEAMARNGEGQPMVWRQYSQSRSNRDANIFGENPFEAPDPAAKRKIRASTTVHDASDHSYGPGVSDSNTSALGGLDD